MNIYPWQKNSWGELFFNESKMAHAYIFYGTQIEEVNKFASEVVRSVLCSNISKEKFACGACQNCVWSKANHPDLKIVDSNFDRDETLKMDNKSVFGKDLMRKVRQYQNENPIK